MRSFLDNLFNFPSHFLSLPPRTQFPLSFSNYSPVVFRFFHFSYVRILAFSPNWEEKIRFRKGRRVVIARLFPRYSFIASHSL